MRPVVVLGSTAIALVLIIAADAGLPVEALRLVAGAALTFVLPGVALLLAMGQPRGPWASLLVVPYSLSVAALGGVVVERLGLGLWPGSILAWLTAVTVSGAVIALLRNARTTV